MTQPEGVYQASLGIDRILTSKKEATARTQALTSSPREPVTIEDKPAQL